jgi:hypothetical protein
VVNILKIYQGDYMSKKELSEKGCEFCGKKFEHLAKKHFGLEEAHILSRNNGPAHAWNIFMLCPNCHTLFDSHIKPKLQNALEKAVTGFGYGPTYDPENNPNHATFVTANKYEEAIGQLTNEEPLKAPASEKAVVKWSTYDHEKKGKM